MGKNARLYLRMTEEELRTLKRVSGKMNMAMSGYVRWIALDSARLIDEGRFVELGEFLVSTSKVMETKST